jgi:hypothetical protein
VETLALARTAARIPRSEAVTVTWARLVTDCRLAGIQRAVKLADALVVATALERGRPGVTEADDYDQPARARPALQVLRVWRLPGRTPIPALIRIMHFSQCRHRSSRQFVRSCVGATAAGRTCRPPDPPTNMPAHRRTSNPAPRPNGDGRTRLSVALRARLPESAASLLV